MDVFIGVVGDSMNVGMVWMSSLVLLVVLRMLGMVWMYLLLLLMIL